MITVVGYENRDINKMITVVGSSSGASLSIPCIVVEDETVAENHIENLVEVTRNVFFWNLVFQLPVFKTFS